MSESRRGTLAGIAAMAWGFAMLATAVYLSTAAYTLFVQDSFVPMSRDVLWMSPLSHTLFFGVPVLPVVWWRRCLPPERVIALAAGVGTWMLVFGFLLPHAELHRFAAVMLAGGVAAVVSRIVVQQADRAVVAAVRAGTVLFALFMVLAAGAATWRSVELRAAQQARPPLAAGQAPNVLLLILDTVRGDALSAYGYQRPTTPYLDTLAASAMLFENAIATAPWTLPSHGSMFTGQYAGRLHSDFDVPLNDRYPTLAEAFRDSGYETAGIVGNQHYTAWDSGLQRGFLYYQDYPRSFVQLLKSSWFGQSSIANQLYRARSLGDVVRAFKRHEIHVPPKPEGDALDARELVDRALAWQAGHTERPWFLFVNFFDAHGPYRPPREAIAAVLPKLPSRRTQQFAARDLYDAEIRFIDGEISRLVHELERRGALQNTLLVVAADHGEQFGEHDLNGHSNSLYLQLLHVPLIMRFDGHLPADKRVERPVSLRDLATTIVDLTDLETPVVFPGQSLAQLAADSATELSPVLAELYEPDSIVTEYPLSRSRRWAFVDETWHYMLRPPAIEELYAWHVDRAEEHDLAASAEGEAIIDSLRSVLEVIVAGDTAAAQTSVFAGRPTPRPPPE